MECLAELKELNLIIGTHEIFVKVSRMDETEKAEETPLSLQLYFDVVREMDTQLFEDKHNLSRGSHSLCDS